MGGPGSGTWYRWNKQDTLDDFPRLRISDLKRQGLLGCAATSSQRWTRDGEEVASVGLRCYDGGLVISYTVAAGTEDEEDVRTTVYFDFTPCHLGGQRTWFLCPRCDRRVGVLVLYARRFMCRHCCELPYACQQETDSDRTSRRIRKIQKRLGSPEWENALEPWFPKPKRMRWTTYRKALRQAERPLARLQVELAAFGYPMTCDWEDQHLGPQTINAGD